MLNGGYLIPANSKRGQLILNFFRPIDLIIFGSGIGVTLLLLMIIGAGGIVKTILVLLPAAVCTLLVMPVPNYHNVLVLITSMYQFLNNRRNYIWKGWCVTNGDNDK